MYNIKIVSGANWGDEGKGLVTNYFSTRDTLVVLSSNSSQRAHTVVHNNRRHVFRHFGSGTLKGATTYFTGEFLVNPVMFREEYEELVKLGYHPKVYCKASCLIVTPYDMLSNQIQEDMLGDNRKSSCGCGVWESMMRFDYFRHAEGTAYNFFIGENHWVPAINSTEYYYRDLYSLIGDNKSKYKMRDFCTLDTRHNLRDDIEFFKTHVGIIADDKEEKELLRSFKNIIFENSQGLMLDTDYCSDVDHTTPAHVGTKIPSQIINKYFDTEETDVESIYVTRTYFTRHGKGDMGELGECPKEMINPYMVDKTNQPNPWQGNLRYGLISSRDLISMMIRISKDLKHLNECDRQVSIFVTHMNEFENYNIESFCTERLFNCDVSLPIYFRGIYYSYGETDKDTRLGFGTMINVFKGELL